MIVGNFENLALRTCLVSLKTGIQWNFCHQMHANLHFKYVSVILRHYLLPTWPIGYAFNYQESLDVCFFAKIHSDASFQALVIRYYRAIDINNVYNSNFLENQV